MPQCPRFGTPGLIQSYSESSCCAVSVCSLSSANSIRRCGRSVRCSGVEMSGHRFRRLEVVEKGFILFGGCQLAVHATLVSLLLIRLPSGERRHHTRDVVGQLGRTQRSCARFCVLLCEDFVSAKGDVRLRPGSAV